jgi:DNA topoisomerase I
MPLSFVDYTSPGVTRRRRNDGFEYYSAKGTLLKSPSLINRITALAIPPAWEQVWICPTPHGHLQALGRDGRGRLQYIYHADFRQERDAAKYSRLIHFAKVLPLLRERVEADMKRPGLPREKVIATIIHLLETTLIRVGNAAYARENQTFGLTTLQNEHLQMEGAKLHFIFRGKSGKDWQLSHQDRRVARIIKSCQELPGQHLFQYLDEEGSPQKISSHHVNAYLKEASGRKISAKDFRTWGGTVLCATELYDQDPASSQQALRKQIMAAVKTVATSLGNTPSVCRSCYIHPSILETYPDGSLKRLMSRAFVKSSTKPFQQPPLKPEEYAVLAVLRAFKRASNKAHKGASRGSDKTHE